MNSPTEILNQLGRNFLNFAWPMLWQSSLLILALFAFEHLFQRKVRASIRYTLWLVVLVKLCVPPTFALPTSPAWWLHKTPPPMVAKPALHYTVTYDDGPLPETSLVPLPAYAPPKPAMGPAAWLLMASAAVSLFLLGWLLVRWWQIARDIRLAKTSERLITLAHEAQTFIGRKSKVEVKLTTNSMSPAVCGLFCPVILIPQTLVENFPDGQLRAVMLHELIHLRRRDVWVNFLQALLQIIYWWHPLVWLANARIRRVREEAVDDAVMLALQDDAESYAPTLLEVAKLALDRPLASLGLVGILESRHALRQRIERLVDFRPPRKAGLTLMSLLGILAFTAVAVPMGNAPDKPGDLSASDGLQTLTVKVNPEVFLRNVKAQAVNYMHATNDDWVPILVDILRCEGVDGVLPDAFEFNLKAGKMTAKNSPDTLEIFRQIIEQLNRPDGKGRPFVPDSSYHRSFHPTSVLIKAQFYAMPFTDFRKVIGYADNVSYDPGNYLVAPIAAERFAEFNQKIKSLGLSPFSSPRVQTGHGILAEFYTGVGTNGVHLDCLPYISAKGVDLAFRANVIGDLSADGTTLVGTANHAVKGRVMAQNHDGIIVCANNSNGSVKNDLVVVLEVQMVTNSPPVNAGHLGRIDPGIETNAGRTTVTGILTDPNFRTVINALKQQTGSETLPEPEVVTTTGHAINRIRTDNISVLLAQTNKTSEGRQEIIRKLQTIRWDSLSFEALPLSEVVRTLHEESKRKDPDHRGLNFMINPYPDQSGPPTIDALTGLLTTNTAVIDSSLIDMPITINPPLTNISLGDVLDALVMVAPEPIHYSVDDYAIVFSAGKPPSPLYSRHFRVGNISFVSALKKKTGLETNNISQMASIYFSKIGVDLNVPGKSVFFNDRLGGELFVRATSSDLDKIEQAIVELPHSDPQVHIKARFLEVPKGALDGLVNATGVANQSVQSNQLAGMVGILTDRNFKTVLHSLAARPGVETLAEPEIVTTSGRQTQMRATVIQTIITNYAFHATGTNSAVYPQSDQVETGPVLDTIPYVLSGDHTIILTLTASLTEFLGYDQPPTNAVGKYIKEYDVTLPVILPSFRVLQAHTQVNLWDNQTVVLRKLQQHFYVGGKEVGTEPDYFVKTKKSRGQPDETELLVFITVTLVDPAGNRIHSDEEIPFAKDGVLPQPK
jgi:beta-lactamase regulating signal transducer with metallopeptidase domain/Flp pilus assembly secretin CpaC